MSNRQMIVSDKLLYPPLDVVFIGASGTGKSSTINMLLGRKVARVGDVEPETNSIQAYQLTDAVRIWDTPGYGDSAQKDSVYFDSLKKLLKRQCHVIGLGDSVVYLIDIVVLIIDAQSRDLGTVTRIIDILKSIQFPARRIILVANRVDLIHSKKERLSGSMSKRGGILQRRIREETGYSLNKPIFFSASTTENIEKIIAEIARRSKFGNRKIHL